jgi:anti-sigma B factor antagonist
MVEGADGSLPSQRPRFSVVPEGDTTVVVVVGELDLATRDDLKGVLGELQGAVVLDFSAVTFLDSSGMSTLVATRKRLRATGGDLRIRRAHDVPRQALELTGLTDFLEHS